MSWKSSWLLPPLSVIEGYTNGGNSEKETYSNFLKSLSKEDLETYTQLLSTQTDDYGLMIFNELKPKMGGRRKKKTRAKKLKRKTRRNK